jgi:hypothetical protein
VFKPAVVRSVRDVPCCQPLAFEHGPFGSANVRRFTPGLAI